MANYQQLSKYSGSLYGVPKYEGIEYDWEVPDNQVIGTPGGVSSVHHHWTKGFNGRGNTSSDIYAGQGPRYISGIYGNLYNTGQEAGQHMGYYGAAPDYKFWENQTPQQDEYSSSVSSMWDPDMKTYGEPGSYMSIPDDSDYKKKDLVEGYQSAVPTGDDFDLVEQSDVYPQENDSVISANISPWILFIVLLILFLVFFFWSQSGFLFVKQYIHKGRTPSWQRMLIYSVVLTVLFGIVFYLSGIGSATFEVGQ